MYIVTSQKKAMAKTEISTSENNIGRNLRLFRDHLGLSQTELAQQLNITREELSYYESGARNVPVLTLKKLADFFGVSTSDLINEEPILLNFSLEFRASVVSKEDFAVLTQFRKIISNYLKIQRLVNK